MVTELLRNQGRIFNNLNDQLGITFNPDVGSVPDISCFKSQNNRKKFSKKSVVNANIGRKSTKKNDPSDHRRRHHCQHARGSLSWTISVAFDGAYSRRRPQHLLDDMLMGRVNVDWKRLQDAELLYGRFEAILGDRSSKRGSCKNINNGSI